MVMKISVLKIFPLNQIIFIFADHNSVPPGPKISLKLAKMNNEERERRGNIWGTKDKRGTV